MSNCEVCIPTMIMLVGLPGSGKSFVAESFKNTFEYIIHSSDALRAELYGDENDQEHNAELFAELHRRIKEDLKNGKSVIYDATNINKKNRIAFLAELKNIRCGKICVMLMTPYDVCTRMNSLRERTVPDDVIRRMYMNWQPPEYGEGFDDIEILWNCVENSSAEWTLDAYVKKIKDFDQENSHHALTLDKHCEEAKKYIAEKAPDNTVLQIAAYLHDCGKPFTKTTKNFKGEEDGECHYYNHHCVGAYDAMLYLLDNEMFTDREIIRIANLIYYHMHPYVEWKQSARCMEKHRQLLGEDLFNEIWLLHEADAAAH